MCTGRFHGPLLCTNSFLLQILHDFHVISTQHVLASLLGAGPKMLGYQGRLAVLADRTSSTCNEAMKHTIPAVAMTLCMNATSGA